MKPLEPLAGRSPIARLLQQAPPEEVRRELAALAALSLDGDAEAARRHAHGAFALRQGRLDDALAALDAAAAGFRDDEAAALSRCEAWLARVRRGPRAVYEEAAEALAELARSPSRAVRVVATHYRATALRYAGQAEATLMVLLDAFADSDGLLVERAQVLNSLGTLYVVLGAYGAAETVLSHAAELNHQIGDRVSEAIAYGQLGSAAMAQGHLDAARRYLQKQEWFASQVGDHFGRARALVLLGDLAVDLGRPDDAIELAEQARAVASEVVPPLRMWVAYATRTIGRARVDMGHAQAHATLEEAQRLFREIGNQLGEALVGWDMAYHAARAGGESRARFHGAAWQLASLGLTNRVAQLLRDVSDAIGDDAPAARAIELAAAAAGQSFPHLATTQEVEQVLQHPDTVAEVATRRIGGQRNLGRLAAHCIDGSGMFVAIVAAAGIGTGLRVVPTPRSQATLVGQLPGVAVLLWPRGVSTAIIARDLSSLRVHLGDDTRAVLGWFPDARVTSIPFAGELGVDLAGVDLGSYVASAVAAHPAKLCVLPGVPWDRESESIARMSGFSAELGS